MSLGHLGRGYEGWECLSKSFSALPGVWAGLGGAAKEPGDRAEEPGDRQKAQPSWCMVLKSKKIKRAK